MHFNKLFFILLALIIHTDVMHAMQTSAEKKVSQDRNYLKPGLRDVLNNSSNFFAGRTSKELNEIIDLAQSFLKSKESIAYFKVELNKNDGQIKEALNTLIETGRQSLIKKGVQPTQLKSAQAQAQKSAAKPAPQPQAKKQPQTNNQPKKQEAKKAQVVQRKPQPQKASNANSNNETAPNANSNNEPVPAAVEIKDSLWKAAADGNIELVKWHLAQGASVNKASPGNETPIIVAAAEEQEAMVDFLIGLGADVNKANLNRYTPLIFAIFRKNYAIAKKLVDAGADVNAIVGRNDTPLMEAAGRGLYDIAKLLLERGANVEAVDNFGQTARNHALMRGRHDIKKLIDEHVAFSKNNMAQQATASINSSPSSDEYVKRNMPNDVKLAEQDQSNFQNNHTINTRQKQKMKRLLFQAAINGDITLIKLLLANGMKINEVNQNKRTLISYAAQYEHEAIIDFLIRLGADINLPDNNGETPLMFAVDNNQISAVEKLIAANADLDAQDMQGSTALIIASKNGFYWLVNTLVDAGADVEKTDYWNKNARQHAQDARIKKRAELIEQKLLNHNKVLQTRTIVPVVKTSIWQEAAKGETLIVLKDLQMGASMNARNDKGKSILMIAAEHGQEDLVEELIKRSAELNFVDEYGNTALQLAIQRNYDEVINMLLDHNVDIKNKNKDGHSALWIAVQMGNKKVIDRLIKTGADLKETDEDGYTLLMLATYLYRFNKNITTMLYEKGVNVNEQDDFGTTALMIAASRGYEESVQELLDAGASLKAEDITGRTALDYASNAEMRAFLEAEIQKRYVHEPKPQIENVKLLTAAKKNDLEAVKAMLKANVNLEIRNENGATPLAQAARWSTLPMVKLLVEAGAVVDSQDDQHKTPMMSAVINGRFDVAEYLLSQGANVNHIESFRTRTPLHWVVRMTKGSIGAEKTVPQMSVETGIKIMNLLLKYGVDPQVRDYENKTALTWAKISKLQEYIKILQKVSSPKTKLSYLNTWDNLLNTHFAYDVGAFA